MDSPLVIDSSVIVKWLNQANEQDLDKADCIMMKALKNEVDLYAPELAKYEVANVLLTGKKLTSKEAATSLSTLYLLPITYAPEDRKTAQQTYSIAEELGITYYDAAFISLAQNLDAPLVTDNLKHQGKATAIEVISLTNYE